MGANFPIRGTSACPWEGDRGPGSLHEDEHGASATALHANEAGVENAIEERVASTSLLPKLADVLQRVVLTSS